MNREWYYLSLGALPCFACLSFTSPVAWGHLIRLELCPCWRLKDIGAHFSFLSSKISLKTQPWSEDRKKRHLPYRKGPLSSGHLFSVLSSSHFQTPSSLCEQTITRAQKYCHALWKWAHAVGQGYPFFGRLSHSLQEQYIVDWSSLGNRDIPLMSAAALHSMMSFH